MKIARIVTIILVLAFVGIVLLEQVPGVMTPTAEPNEALMFNLFKISLLDDITHALSGVLGLLALFFGYKMSVKYLMLVGGYYALDAFFYVVNGFMTGQSIIDNALLNGPHIAIAVLVAYALSKTVKNIELA